MTDSKDDALEFGDVRSAVQAALANPARIDRVVWTLLLMPDDARRHDGLPYTAPPPPRPTPTSKTRSATEGSNGDRKSVVEGKSVDLGGRRNIKKKKKKQKGGWKRRKEGHKRHRGHSASMT